MTRLRGWEWDLWWSSNGESKHVLWSLKVQCCSVQQYAEPKRLHSQAEHVFPVVASSSICLRTWGWLKCLMTEGGFDSGVFVSWGEVML